MAKKSAIRGRVREGLAKLNEASACADQDQAERLISQALVTLNQVAFASEIPGTQVRERDFTQAERDKGAKSGAAMADGSYLIDSQQDAENAWQLRGRSKNHSEASVVAHIRKRVKALGLKMPGGDQARESKTIREMAGAGEISLLQAVARRDHANEVGLLRAMGLDRDELKGC